MPFNPAISPRPSAVYPVQYASATPTPANSPRASIDATPTPYEPEKQLAPTDESGFSFRDLVSIINPLQHIPIIGTIYRAVTGDTIKAPAKIIGGTLFGGPLGLIASVAESFFEQATGKDIGGHAIALFSPGKPEQKQDPLPPGPQYANASPAPVRTAAAVSPGAPWGAQSAPTPASAPASPIIPASLAPAADTPVEPPPTQRTELVGGAEPVTMSASRSLSVQGRTLAQYQNYAGQRLPVVDPVRSTNGGATAGARSAPVPMQTTLPLVAERVRTPTTPRTSIEVATQDATSDSAKESASATDDKANADEWVSSALLRNLDRYREMKQRQTQQAPKIDQAI